MPVVTRVIMSAVKKQLGNRKFYALPEDYALKTNKFRSPTLKKEDSNKLIKYIDDNVIGKNTTFAGPYGRRKVVYCDYAASGRALQFIEDYIIKEVLPVYGNTHTTTSITSMQSTLLRHEARDIIRNAVHASEDDVVIFCGHGCTAAVHKLIHSLAISEPPVVFVGPCEHHSNLLPWREIQAKVVRISETREGFLDLVDLENQLQLHRQLKGSDRLMIGCFSAASNITGILADDIATTLLLHQYNALAFWDYATAAPYVQLDMNPILPGMDEKSVHKDAMFFSGHKFVGGVQTPGVLVAKKRLFVNPVPSGCGGGSVFFVRQNSHCYLKDTEMREEGGTAGIVESIRLGLTMQLKQTLGVPAILAREERITKMVLSHLRNIPEVVVLGNSTQSGRRLPVFSLLVRHPRGSFLHHNFVCAVLNDVFGVQARGGCACAGPYAQDLLGINDELAAQFEQVLMEDDRLDRHQLRRKEEHSSFEMLRPGFTRLSLPYFMADAEVTYVLEAVKMVATEGWKLLPQYQLNPETGEWRHHTNSVFKDRKWLGSVRYVDGKMSVHERRISGVAACPADTNDCLHTARNIFNKARKMAQRYPLADQCVMFDERTSPLRWFMLPSEAQDLLLGNVGNVRQSVPFMPREYHGSRGGVSPPSTPTPLPHHVGGGGAFARHNSLSALDIRAKRTRERLDSQSPIALHQSGSAPQFGPMAAMRERCYSLDSNNKLTPTIAPSSPSPSPSCPSPATLALLSSGGGNRKLQTRQRQISCGSQTDLSQSGNEGDTESRGTTPPTSISENAEQIQAYVQEVTKELATEIKSEIREVINKVEDVLSESADSLETNGSAYAMSEGKRYSIDFNTPSLLPTQQTQSYQHNGGYSLFNCSAANQFYQPILSLPPNQMTYQQMTNPSSVPNYGCATSVGPAPVNGSLLQTTNSSDSVYADHVAEYLAELTSEVVSDLKSELKSEFREMVSAVDGLISPSVDSSRSTSSENGDEFKSGANPKSCTHVAKRTTADAVNSVANATAPNVGGSGEALKVISEGEEMLKLGHPTLREMRRSTLNSISSQDSGINMNYHDRDSSVSPSDCSLKNGIGGGGERGDSRQSRRLLTPDAKSQSADERRTDADADERRTDADTDADADADEGGISFEARNRKLQWHCPPKNVWKPMTEAIKEFGMVEEGDRVLVCLSGGKDSLSLLHALRQYQCYVRAKHGLHFSLGAATVDPRSSAYDPSPLIPYLRQLNVHYLYEEQSILEQASKAAECKSICSFCSRMKRGRLYATARAHNYNVLALGQHLDDIAESFLMSTFHNGRLRSMKAHYLIREQDLRVIRPLVYVREKALRQFAESRHLPVIPENCPACFQAPKERHRTKQLLAQQEILFPKLFQSLRSALKPLISFRKTGEESRAYNQLKVGPIFDTDNDTDDTEEDPVSVKSNNSDN